MTIDVRFCNTTEEESECRKLVLWSYSSRGLIPNVCDGCDFSGICGGMSACIRMYETKFFGAPTTKIVRAKNDGLLVGTVSCIWDSELGVPTDVAFKLQVDEIRAKGSVGEMSCIAGIGGNGMAAVRMLVWARDQMLKSCDWLVGCVHPRHVSFWVRLGFTCSGVEAKLTHLNDAPAVFGFMEKPR